MEFMLVPWLEQWFTLNRTVDEWQGKPTDIEQDPFHYLNWLQLGGRHNPLYYERLKRAMLCCCYGGNFVYLEQGPGIARWDSWRLWEAFAAGCIPIHVDLEKYGLLLPVMPENWTHYIGIDLANPKEVLDRLQDEPDAMTMIAAQGKQWALQHYQPVAIACYFLDILAEEPLGTTYALFTTLNDLS